MSPTTFLLLVIGVTLTAWAAQMLLRHRRAAPLRHLARAHGMHFCHSDRFRFAPLIAEQFPIPGAADVKILDLIYGSHDEMHRYVFTIEFTRGVVRTKSRHRRVAAFVEPRRARLRKIDLRLSDDGKSSVAEQYNSLCEYVQARKSNPG